MKKTVTTTTITDDLGGDGAASTVVFHHDGRTFEIDLNKRNAETFARRIEALYGPYVVAARDITDKTPKSVPTASEKAFKQRARAWAHANGWQISDRGRVPEEILTAYINATGDKP